MDELQGRTRKRNEKDREAYKNMPPENKAKLLERRRQRYGQHVTKFRETQQTSESVSTSCEVEILETVERASIPTFSQNPADGSSVNNIEILDNYNHDSFPNSANGSQERCSARNRLINHLSRLMDVGVIPWELPRAPQCKFCRAYKFFREPPSFCCANGEVSLAPIASNPILLHLFTADMSNIGIRFRRRVRTYNNNLALTSIGMKTDPHYAWSNQGIYTLKVNGQVTHKLEAFNRSLELPRRLQLFFLDTADDIYIDCLNKYDLERDILDLLLKALANNPYFRIFKRLRSWENLENCKIVLRANPQVDRKTHNLPNEQQVAAIWDETTDDPEDMNRDIIVYGSNCCPHAIFYHYGCYDPLQYPLLFPHGEPSWHAGIERNSQSKSTWSTCIGQSIVAPASGLSATDILQIENEVYVQNRKKRTNVSCGEYTAYRSQFRDGELNCIIHSGRLGQQFSIDSYIKIETQRLDYYRIEQQQFDARTESLQGIVDAVGVDGLTDPTQIGQRIVLPSSFIGGPRDMMKRYINAMALVQNYGNPDLFITMTYNPNWKEIKDHLLPTEEPHDRPDLVARVFRAKLEEFKDEVIKRKLFGEIVAYVYVVEYQKRGLPHAHWIIILKREYKLTSPELYDKIISAELPNDANSLLHSYVVSHMMHGPCGVLNPKNVCMRDGVCKNKYPKDFCDVTAHGRYTYPNYKRRNDGRKVLVRNVYLDNRYVVPYCPYLLAKFNCHINVEACSDFKLVKYLYKYVYKGHDRINYNIVGESFVNNIDEIKEFQKGRWISSVEAYWRIFSFDITEMYPPVIILPIHLPNQQYVCFGRKKPLNEVLTNPFIGKTMLTEFFAMNACDPIAKQLNLLYREFPEYFVWEQKYRKWKQRKKQVVLGRVAVVDPLEGERYFLKVLLSNIRGPTSYEHLLCVDDQLCTTFRDAALHRGLLESDVYAEQCLEEVARFQMPSTLRKLFAILLIHYSPPDPRQLYTKFFDVLSDDFSRNATITKENVEKRTLQSIDEFLMCMGKSIHDYALTSQFHRLTEEEKFARDLAYEKDIVVSADDLLSIGKLNERQRLAFISIINKVNYNKGGGFFVDGPGGTGKTFLYRALLAYVRSNGYIALAAATSGVAASLLPGGRTAHSRFKLPIDTENKSDAKISKQSSLAKMILIAKLIIWDEASMANRKIIEAFDRLLKDITDEKTKLFGGKVVVFGGDFRQTLPIVPYGTKSDMIDASFVSSNLWPQLTKIKLVENIRAKDDPFFTSFLLAVGDGTVPSVF